MIIVFAFELFTELVITPHPGIIADCSFVAFTAKEINSLRVSHSDVIIDFQNCEYFSILRHSSKMTEFPVDCVEEDDFIVVELEG